MAAVIPRLLLLFVAIVLTVILLFSGWGVFALIIGILGVLGAVKMPHASHGIMISDDALFLERCMILLANIETCEVDEQRRLMTIVTTNSLHFR